MLLVELKKILRELKEQLCLEEKKRKAWKPITKTQKSNGKSRKRDC